MSALRWETFPDPGGGYRWRALAGNGRVVAVSPGDYPTERNARRAMVAFQVAARSSSPAASVPAVLDRCSCKTPKLSKTVTSLCTACGLRRG